MKGVKTMAKQKKNGHENKVAKLALVTAILTLLNNLITLIVKLIEILNK